MLLSTIDIFSSQAAEYTAVTIRVQGVDVTIVTLYVLIAVIWDAWKFIQVRRILPRYLLCAGTLIFITKLG